MPSTIDAERGPTQQQKQNQQVYRQIVNQVPSGYEIVAVERVTPSPQTAYDPSKPLEKKGPVTGQDYYSVTLQKKVEPQVLVYAPDPLFGLEVQYPYDIAPAELKKQAVRVGTYNYEERSVTGLGLATAVAVGVGVPLAGAVAVTSVGVGETVKYAVSGEHLTPAEAVGIAGIAELGAIGAMRAAPAVRSGLSNLANRLSPERAMYNRVVVQSEQPQGEAGLWNRFVGKVSPERSLYNRVVRNVEPVQPKEVLGGGGGGGDFNVQPYRGGGGGYAQQVLYKQAPVVKAPMKNFAPVISIPKTATILSVTAVTPEVKQAVTAKPMQEIKPVTMQQTVLERTAFQEAANPFATYQGKPFYTQRSRVREETELVYLSYPKEGLAPAMALKVTPLVRQLPSSLSVQDVLGVQIQAQGYGAAQVPAFAVVQETQQVQESRQVQRAVQEVLQVQKQPELFNPKWMMGGFSLQGGGAKSDFFNPRGVGKYRKQYPIATAKQVWRDIFG